MAIEIVSFPMKYGDFTAIKKMSYHILYIYIYKYEIVDSCNMTGNFLGL